jgi:protein involved in polysaccharide export with SLBB domain
VRKQLLSLARLASVAWLASGCASSAQSVDPTTVGTSDRSLGAGDTFEVRVYGQKELSSTFRVADDGTINFPLLGPLKVAGLESSEVEKLVQHTLVERKILRDPQISVFVLEQSSTRIRVMGAVEEPGTFSVRNGMTVIEAIGLAGGFTDIAQQNDTILTRTVDGQRQRFRVPVEDVAKGQAQDVELMAGDMIYVPERIF